MPVMKAVRIHTYGGTDVLTYEDVPRPSAGPGEVLIRVHATTVNPSIGKVLAEVATMVDAGEIRPEISRILPLAEIQQAHDWIERRHTRGKIVVQVVQ